MKKLLSLLLAALLLMGLTAPALADMPEVEFDAVLVERFGLTAAEWYADDVSRVMLATCMALDIGVCDNEEAVRIIVDAITYGKIYVGLDANERYMTILFVGQENSLSLDFNPANDYLTCWVMKIGLPSIDVFIREITKSGLVETCYEVSTDDVMTAMEVLLDSLDE